MPKCVEDQKRYRNREGGRAGVYVYARVRVRVCARLVRHVDVCTEISAGLPHVCAPGSGCGRPINTLFSSLLSSSLPVSGALLALISMGIIYYFARHHVPLKKALLEDDIMGMGVMCIRVS